MREYLPFMPYPLEPEVTHMHSEPFCKAVCYFYVEAIGE